MNDTPLPLRILWFLFVGLWLGWIVMVCAWIACLTVIGLPFGLWLFNRVPMVMTLKAPERETTAVQHDGFYYVRSRDPSQTPLPIRLLWFLAFGWWFSFVWIHGAYLLASTFIGLPFAFWMFNRIPKVLWLTEA